MQLFPYFFLFIHCFMWKMQTDGWNNTYTQFTNEIQITASLFYCAIHSHLSIFFFISDLYCTFKVDFNHIEFWSWAKIKAFKIPFEMYIQCNWYENSIVQFLLDNLTWPTSSPATNFFFCTNFNALTFNIYNDCCHFKSLREMLNGLDCQTTCYLFLFSLILFFFLQTNIGF